MFPYILIFVITAMLAFLSFDKPKVQPLPFFLYTLALGTFVGVADMLGGYDRYIYCDVFTSNANLVAAGEGWHNYIFEMYFDKEPVYGYINTLIGYITPNRYIFIYIYTMLIYIVYSICFYRYTPNPFFALLVFLGLMFFFTFTYLRQVLAAGVIWLALPFYTNRRTLPYMAMVVVAALIHNSAAIAGALYFMPLKKWPWKYVVTMMIILLGIGLIGIGGLFVATGEVVNNENVSAHAAAAEYGFRYEYVVEAIVFLFILYKNYNTIKEDKVTISYLNLYLMFCGILLLFCKSSDGGRIAWYGVMGIIIMLTRFCSNWRGVQLRYFLTILFFGLFFRILYFWDIQLYPYKTFFTDGIRANDPIYEMYEYDENYKIDKFYNLSYEKH